MEPMAYRVVPDGLRSLMEPAAHHVRRASDLVGYVDDPEALQRLVDQGNPVIYETWDADIPESAGHLRFGITVIHPGRIGDEFYLTKGHFHVRRETAEVYYGLQGHGYLVMQKEDGEFRAVPIEPGSVVYVPPGWAHRSVNTGSVPLVMLFVYPGEAGHDYETIRATGFRQVVVERDGAPAVVPARRS